MVYIKSINKNIFASYINPLEDELFSSWLCRISVAHEVKANTFILNYFGKDKSIFNRDIDLFMPKYLVDILVKHTPLCESEVCDLFLPSYGGYIVDSFYGPGTNNIILPIGIKHRKRLRYGQQCCPVCLSKGIPYYKKNWRLFTSIICTRCNSYLIDRCYSCGAPITFFRVNMKERQNSSVGDYIPLYHCYNCLSDLRSFNPNQVPSVEEIEYQLYIDDTIRNGFNDVTQYSFSYLRVLLILAKRIRSSANNNRLRDVLPKEFKDKIQTIKGEVRYWSVDERKEILPFTYKLLKDFPNKIVPLIRKSKLTKSYLVKDVLPIPYWFQKYLTY